MTPSHHALATALVACMLLMPGPAAALEQEEQDMDEEILCGVFYRVMVGALMSQDRARGSDRSALIQVYQQRMYERMATAKRLTTGVFGEQDGLAHFDERWRNVYSEMIGGIDRNYSRLYILRNRYGDRCSLKLELSLEE